jgi:predicted nucleotidyltransferase
MNQLQFGDKEEVKFLLKKEILESLGIKEEDTLSILAFGSRVYQCEHENSDFDLVIILKDESKFNDDKLKSKKLNIDAQIFKESEYSKKLNSFEIDALECFSLNKNKETKKFEIFNISKLDIPPFEKNALRKSIDERSRISWVKSKKKLELESNGYVGNF